MISRAFLSHLLRLLRHPLSPIPLIVVCTGFWLPLDFLEDGNELLAIQSIMGRLHVIATAVIWNLALSALGAIFVYVAAGLAAVICRVPFQKNARAVMSFTIHLAVLIPLIYLLRLDSIVPLGWCKPFLLLGIVSLVAFSMTRINFRLVRYLFLPQLLVFLLVPASMLLVAEEAIGVTFFSGSGVVGSVRLHDQRLPDIILLTIDTLSASHLHTYGYQRPNSPNLDKFAENAIVFNNFYANANWTRPGIASILNGARPWTHEADIEPPLRDFTEKQNLIVILAAAGYDVDVVQSNEFADFGSQGISLAVHKISLDAQMRFFGWLPIERLPSAPIARNFGLPNFVARFENTFLRYPAGKNLPYLSASEKLLDKASSRRPIVFWLHVITPHDPYAASAQFLGKFDASADARSAFTSEPYVNFAKHIDPRRQNLLEARYDEAILQTDDLIGRFIQMLKQQGRFENSLIVVTADHGESFLPVYGAHGGPLLTEELIHVPCLIKPPSTYTPKHESRLMEQADLLPTILTYAGLPLPAGSEGLPYQDKPDNLPVFAMNRDLRPGEHTLNLAMLDGDWKFVIHLGRWKYPWPQQELYNLAEDPDEKANLTGSQPDRAAAMRQRVLAEIAQHGISLSEYQH